MAGEHKLWNPSGEYGRGLFYEETETVVTWPEEEMTHDERHKSLVSIEDPCIGSGNEWPVEFYIHETGALGQYCLTKAQAERVLELVPSIKPPTYWR